jgi:hypothetical protein
VIKVFGSAVSVSYSGVPASLWAPFASAVLDASYEATLLAGLDTKERHKGTANSDVVYLTLLGGGVFGNDMDWICSAIYRACTGLWDSGLDVRIVVYSPGYESRGVQEMVTQFNAEQADRLEEGHQDQQRQEQHRHQNRGAQVVSGGGGEEGEEGPTSFSQVTFNRKSRQGFDNDDSDDNDDDLM